MMQEIKKMNLSVSIRDKPSQSKEIIWELSNHLMICNKPEE